ncbi:retinoid-inducible serine carboxypeptidase-like isoform X2 [Dysidea avara]|uniref:retinoid-inducible serine carboxypeptidase-like isoform X2 n=1 Tax=Dysidea avara TaxID=196820 RepID=UPI003320EE1F
MRQLGALLFSCIVLLAIAQDHDEEWGYVGVRPGANMFWWFYRALGNWKDKPLVMWLQGGPGASSTGFGNFVEIGPLDINLVQRNTTWAQSANILFVDNPVGTGFSYVTSKNLLTTSVVEISLDLLAFLKQWYQDHQQYHDMPFYIFSESYGGKMTAAFGSLLITAIKEGRIKCDFKGVALGDSWISPIDSVTSWGPVLYANSLINIKELKELNSMATDIDHALQSKQFKYATELWSKMEDYIDDHTDHVDIYNFLVHGNSTVHLSFNQGYAPTEPVLLKAIARHVLQDDALSALMNGPIRKKFGSTIPENVTWGGQSGAVFEAQSVDFMKDVLSELNYLLLYGVRVVIYSGQLDIICATQGTLAWVEKLKWNGLPDFLAAPRTPLYADTTHKASGYTDGFHQAFHNMEFYWILNAGHMVPKDNGKMALKMLKMVTGQ